MIKKQINTGSKLSTIKTRRAPVFIVGSPRSGTTLLANILGRHTNLFMPGETFFFDDIYSRRQALGKPFDPKAFEVIFKRLNTLYGRFNFPEDQQRIDKIFAAPEVKMRMQTECKSYEDVLNFFMEIQAAQVNKHRWGNQVPKDLFNVPAIRSFYPNGKIIICVRNIQSFLHSYKFKWRNTSPENVMRIKALYHPVITSFLWKASMRKVSTIQRQVPEKDCTVVRYEDLVMNPERTIRRVCAIIEETFEHEMLNISSDNSSFGGGKGIFKESMNRWRTGLSNEEIALALWIGGKDLKAMGYPKEQIGYNLLKLGGLILSAPLALSKALKAGDKLRGPLFPYLKHRFGFGKGIIQRNKIKK